MLLVNYPHARCLSVCLCVCMYASTTESERNIYFHLACHIPYPISHIPAVSHNHYHSHSLGSHGSPNTGPGPQINFQPSSLPPSPFSATCEHSHSPSIMCICIPPPSLPLHYLPPFPRPGNTHTRAPTQSSPVQSSLTLPRVCPSTPYPSQSSRGLCPSTLISGG